MSDPESTPPPPPHWATELPAEDPLPGWRESTPTPTAPPSRGSLPRNDEPNYQPLRRADRPRGLLVSPSLHGPAPFDAIELELEPEIEIEIEDEPIEELLEEELDREYDAAEALIEEIAAENEAAEAALEEESHLSEPEVAFVEEPTPLGGTTTVEAAPEIAPAEVEASEPEREGGWAPETDELEDVSSEDETSLEVAEPEGSVEAEMRWNSPPDESPSELTEAPPEAEDVVEDQADEPREPTMSDREESAEDDEDDETSKRSG